MTPKELRAKKDKDLQGFLKKWGKELGQLKIQASIGQCQNSARIGHLRRAMARVKTIIGERDRDAGRAAEK